MHLDHKEDRIKADDVTGKNNRKDASEKDLHNLLRYISLKWHKLVRNNYGILDLAVDPKWPLRTGERWIVYVRGEDVYRVRRTLASMNPAADMKLIEVRDLPDNAVSLPRQGALYLPYPYVVPGGRFQEMYAWDSFFIFLGLLQDKEIRLAQNMVDNHIYMVEHYGAVLNGNRSYYITRSQLPFLGEMVLRQFSYNNDREWLLRGVRACEVYYTYYTSGGHKVGSTGLNRFFDFGPSGSPPPEADVHEKDKQGRTPHDRVKEWYRAHYSAGIDDYEISTMYDYQKDELTPFFFDNDRAMRESGFDTSCRFGPFGANCLAYLPICLNSLLYQLERNIAAMYAILGSTVKAASWRAAASWRKAAITRYCWDDEDGFFYDYDHIKGCRRRYLFGTTFLPLWVGLATPYQASRVVRNGMNQLSYPGGLCTSTLSFDTQWDLPFGWAPLQLFAVEGMWRYGYRKQADRIAINFSSTVLKCFISTGELWEKYDVLRRSEKVQLRFGYDTNEIGFGWTCAVFSIFLSKLETSQRTEVLKLDGIGAHDSDDIETYI